MERSTAAAFPHLKFFLQLAIRLLSQFSKSKMYTIRRNINKAMFLHQRIFKSSASRNGIVKQTIVASRPVGTAMHPKAWRMHPTEHKHHQRKHAASCRTSLRNDNCHKIFDNQSHSNTRGLTSINLNKNRLCEPVVRIAHLITRVLTPTEEQKQVINSASPSTGSGTRTLRGCRP